MNSKTTDGIGRYNSQEQSAGLEESPTNLDRAYDDYVFRVDPLPGTFDAEST
jgi:hypothetical protein